MNNKIISSSNPHLGHPIWHTLRSYIYYPTQAPSSIPWSEGYTPSTLQNWRLKLLSSSNPHRGHPIWHRTLWHSIWHSNYHSDWHMLLHCHTPQAQHHSSPREHTYQAPDRRQTCAVLSERNITSGHPSRPSWVAFTCALYYNLIWAQVIRPEEHSYF